MVWLCVESPPSPDTISLPDLGLRSMNFRFQSISRILAVLLLVGTVASAQQEETGGALSPEAIKALRNARSDKAETSEGEKPDESRRNWKDMTPEERLDASLRRGSKAHCRFVAACRPPKLMPGQSGTLLITAILQGQSVLPAPLQMTMTPRVPGDLVTVGTLAAHPAEPGTIAKAYIGRPVYENTAVFEMPITMAATAKLGQKQPVAVDLQFDVYSGESGQAVGRFVERVSTDIEVAPYVEPAVSGRATPKAQDAAQPVPVAPAASSSDPEQSDASASKPANDAMGGVALPVPAPGAGPEEVPEPQSTGGSELPPTGSEGGGVPGMLIVGGVAFLLVIVLLLMRKK
jgi:hypothetical protein